MKAPSWTRRYIEIGTADKIRGWTGNSRWSWRLCAGNHVVLAVGNGYGSKKGAENAVSTLFIGATYKIKYI